MTWFLDLKRRTLMLFASVILLSGCQEVLYSELTEADANEMVALLVLSGIPADREKDKDKMYSVLVDGDDIALAVTVLKNSGLPREKFASLGEIFGDPGVVGTPFEERVRFAYATNEELSHTITQIKGIETARVHVVIPPEERFGKSSEPARASVAIFHDRSFAPSEYSGRIKTMVAFAVPGLEIENVSTSFFLTPGFVVQPSIELPQNQGSIVAAASADGMVDAAPLSAYKSRVMNLPWLDIGALLVAVILVRLLVLGWRRLRLSWGH